MSLSSSRSRLTSDRVTHTTRVTRGRNVSDSQNPKVSRSRNRRNYTPDQTYSLTTSVDDFLDNLGTDPTYVSAFQSTLGTIRQSPPSAPMLVKENLAQEKSHIDAELKHTLSELESLKSQQEKNLKAKQDYEERINNYEMALNKADGQGKTANKAKVRLENDLEEANQLLDQAKQQGQELTVAKKQLIMECSTKERELNEALQRIRELENLLARGLG